MQRRAPGVLQSVQAIVDSNFGGQIRPGDIVGIWAFNDGVARARPFEVWSATNRVALSAQLTGFVQALKYENQASLDKVVPELNRLFQEPALSTVILLSSGDDEIHGTPFDEPINRSQQQWRDSQQKARMPILTLLRGANGHTIAWSVTPAPWPLEFPPLPAALPVEPPLSAGTNLASVRKPSVVEPPASKPPKSNSKPQFAPLPATNLTPRTVRLTNMSELAKAPGTPTSASPSPDPAPAPTNMLRLVEPSTVAPINASLPLETNSLRGTQDPPEKPAPHLSTASTQAIDTLLAVGDPAPGKPQPSSTADAIPTNAAPSAPPVADLPKPAAAESAAAPPATPASAEIPASSTSHVASIPDTAQPAPAQHSTAATNASSISSAESPGSTALPAFSSTVRQPPRRSFLVENALWLALLLVASLGAAFCFLSYFRSARRPSPALQPPAAEPEEAHQEQPPPQPAPQPQPQTQGPVRPDAPEAQAKQGA